MVAVKLSVYVGKDRKLEVKLPDNAPIGMVQIEITPIETQADDDNELRSQLIASGLLVNPDDMNISDDLGSLSDEELEQLPALPPGAPTALDLVNEDRGTY